MVSERDGGKVQSTLHPPPPPPPFAPSATSCSHGDVVAFLAAVPSINKELRDCDGATATEVTSDPNIRVLLLNR